MPVIKAKKLRVRRDKNSPWSDIPAVAKKGEDGVSPTLKVTQEGDNVRVEATDINGQTSATVIGGGGGGGVNFTPGNALELTPDGVLNVKTTDTPETDNTLPITSAGVAATVGNIETILKTI